jgi:hypothetical protein
MENEITLHDIERRLAALEKAVTSLTAEKNEQKPKAPIDFSHIGGKKVGHAVPSGKPVDFSAIGGVCVRKAPKPDAPEGSKEDEA